MAVTKRTRFEVLRRDNYTCRYCHATDSPLTVDHVMPVALGGGDDPANLVTACRDCNAGKSSESPDAATVAQVSEFALRWRAAMDQAVEDALEQADIRAELVDYFHTEWHEHPSLPDLPVGWEESVSRFYGLGLRVTLLDEAVRATAARFQRMHGSERAFRYFAGVCWQKIRDIQDAAARIYEEAGRGA